PRIGHPSRGNARKGPSEAALAARFLAGRALPGRLVARPVDSWLVDWWLVDRWLVLHLGRPRRLVIHLVASYRRGRRQRILVDVVDRPGRLGKGPGIDPRGLLEVAAERRWSDVVHRGDNAGLLAIEVRALLLVVKRRRRRAARGTERLLLRAG